jgi:hypothetical protein
MVKSTTATGSTIAQMFNDMKKMSEMSTNDITFQELAIALKDQLYVFNVDPYAYDDEDVPNLFRLLLAPHCREMGETIGFGNVKTSACLAELRTEVLVTPQILKIFSWALKANISIVRSDDMIMHSSCDDVLAGMIKQITYDPEEGEATVEI